MTRPLCLLVLLAAAGAAHAAGPLTTLPPKGPQNAEPPRPPPLSLTASDGTGLRITSLTARAVVEDPLAFTELRLVFRNPEPRQIEGQFTITLPEGAAISRFAMRQGNAWQEGEVVELQAAREAYEDFLHRRQDPALLEKAAGNVFSARVFPIPPSGEKELIVSYSQERVRAGDPYRVFLRGLPRLDSLDVSVIVEKAEEKGGGGLVGTTVRTVGLKKTGYTPDADFEVAVPPASRPVGLRHDNLVAARVTPVGAARPSPVSGLVVLLDTSASRALGFAGQLGRLQSLLAQLGAGAGAKLPLRVLAFDQEVEEIFSGAAADFGERQLARLRERRALGASDLGKALAAAGGAPRVLLVTDGIPTAGPTDGAELRARAQKLAGRGVRRLDALVFGGIRDESLLRGLCTAGLPEGGVVIDGDLSVAEAARRLTSATFSGLAVTVPGSRWRWPERLDGVQPGDEVLVFADLDRGQPLQIRLGDGPGAVEVRPALAEVPRPLLERAWVGARIRRLLHQRDTLAAGDSDLREGLRRQVIELSTRHRVLSEYTALLVLETEADYARFRIDRRALADILTVGSAGVEVVARRGAPLLARPDLPGDGDLDDRGGQESAFEGAQGGAPAAGGAPAKRSARVSEDRMDRAPSPPRSVEREKAKRDESGPRGGASSSRYPTNMMPAGPSIVSKPRPTAPPVEAPKAEAAAAMAAPAARPMAPPPPPRPEPRARAAEETQTSSVSRRPAQPLAQGRPRDERPALALATPPRPPETSPYEGRLAAVMAAIKAGRRDEALRLARAWQDEQPGDVLALIALGEALEALGAGQRRAAARVYGSLIDLFPGRADLRRFAGERLERLAADGLPLAIDSFEKARAQRPDHPASHRLLAFAQLKAGRPDAALATLLEGLGRAYPDGRFAGVQQILSEDAGLAAAAWLRRDPSRRREIEERLAAAGARLPEGPSLRFILNWETDANDVDFHIYDGKGGHAFYSQRELPSGGRLYADVTTGYGPECFTIEGPRRAYPYTLQAHYYSRGPMGYGMGKLQIVEHDGKGGLRFDERPFVIMVDHAFVDLGTVSGAVRAAP